LESGTGNTETMNTRESLPGSRQGITDEHSESVIPKERKTVKMENWGIGDR